MSSDPLNLSDHQRPDYALAPWNVWRPPGNWAEGRPFQSPPVAAATPYPSTLCSPGCRCGYAVPAAAQYGCRGVAQYWWPEEDSVSPIRQAMDHYTSPTAPMPSGEILREISAWCKDEAMRKQVLESLKDRLAAGGDGAHKALYYLQCVSETAIGGLADVLESYVDDSSTPLPLAIHASRYRDVAKGHASAAAAEKNKALWEEWQKGVGNPRCAWRPPPEEIGKPLPLIEEPKAVDGWRWALFNKTIMDIHAYCQNGYEWPK